MVDRLVNPLISDSFFCLVHAVQISRNFSLDPAVEDRLSRNLNDLHLVVGDGAPEWIVIDEVQKVPPRVNVVH